jgi:hypothetical protein
VFVFVCVLSCLGLSERLSRPIPWQLGRLLAPRAAGPPAVACTFPFFYSPPPPSLRPAAVGPAGGPVRLRLTGYAATLGPDTCTVLFSGVAGGEIAFPAAAAAAAAAAGGGGGVDGAWYNATAPAAAAPGLAAVSLACASAGPQDLGLTLAYAPPPRAEVQGGGAAACALFAPCTAQVRLFDPPAGAAGAGGLRAWVPGAVFAPAAAASGGGSPSVQVRAGGFVLLRG